MKIYLQMKNTMSFMGKIISFAAVFLFSLLLFYPQVGFASIPPAGTSTLDLVKKDKHKFRPACYSTFMTLNVENIQFQRTAPFFHYQNLAYGLKIGTMRNAGWYLSLMSNFYFNGFLTPIDIQEVNPSGNSNHSYFDGLFGLTFRYCKPLSFHLGVGYHYKTTNYKTLSGSWGHLPKEDVHGPMAAAGFMFHMSGFVLSAEAVANYNLKAHTFTDGLGVGFKVGIGFCVENKNSAKSKKTKIKKNSDKMPASELHFFPTTAGPEEYDVIFRHSYTKPKPEFMAILEADTLLSKLPQPEYLKTNHPDENRSADMPDGAAETHGQEVAQSELVIINQEGKTAPKNDSVSVTKTVMSSAAQPQQQPEQQSEQAAQTTHQNSQTIQTPVQEENIVDMTQSPANPVPPCSELTVKDVDGNSYHTLAIGNQCWMRENMRATRFSNGDSIMLGQSFDFRHAVRYFPGGDSSNVDAYGCLYNWNAVTHSGANNGNQYVQGMCPEGWHIPSIAEWEDLFGYLSGQSAMNCKNNTQYVAKALAAKSGWAVSEMDCAVGNQASSNNVSGFNALPAGIFVGKFDFFGKIARFWSSSVSLAQGKCDVYMSWDEAVVKKSDQEPAVVGFSVRCLKN
jgi:uncharacterized protein (TIGR02145 family)